MFLSVFAPPNLMIHITPESGQNGQKLPTRTTAALFKKNSGHRQNSIFAKLRSWYISLRKLTICKGNASRKIRIPFTQKRLEY